MVNTNATSNCADIIIAMNLLIYKFWLTEIILKKLKSAMDTESCNAIRATVNEAEMFDVVEQESLNSY